jgi:hypothetical protein
MRLLHGRRTRFGLAAWCLLISPPIQSTDAPTVRADAPMHVPRMAHTATALGDGRVLIAGGFTGQEAARWGAELYDSRAGRFLPTGPLQRLRHSHTATRLRSGEVLLTGGFSSGGQPVRSAELYDPRHGTWRAVGNLVQARSGHTAVLLRDGRVLIAGGVGPDWAFLASAEIFDPTTQQFSAVAPMSVARESHVAVRLTDGRVLVIGGHQGRRSAIQIYATTEIFDPRDGRWSRAGSMAEPRHKHDAVVLRDGRVFVTGGSDERRNIDAYRSTEIYDPVGQRFSPGPQLSVPRYKHQYSSVVMADSTVLVLGGAAVAERCDLSRNVCVTLLTSPRMGGSFSAVAELPSGDVLIAGGYGNGTGPRAETWRLRP